MFRLWLLALLAPVLASAAPPTPGAGQVTFETILHSDTDGYINLAECASGSISLAWSPNYSTTAFTGGSIATTDSFQLYASNKPPGDTCFTENDTQNSVVAGAVGNPIRGSLTNPMTASFDTALITSVAGKSCTSASGDEDVFLCIQAKTAGNTAIGVARLMSDGTSPAKLVLSRARPNAPTSVGARPGEQAANVTWSDGGSSDSFRIDAWVGTATTGTPTVSSPRITGTSYRLGGLTNDEVWTLRVTAFSVSGNPNLDPSPLTSVTPSHVLDFYSMYQAGGGREQGGCSGGPAGPVALLAASLALLAVRRKKK